MPHPVPGRQWSGKCDTECDVEWTGGGTGSVMVGVSRGGRIGPRNFLGSQSHGIALCIELSFMSNNDESLEAMTSLENWIEENDEKLEKGKHDA